MSALNGGIVMRVLRYLLSLVANGIMTVVGGFLAGTGLFALFATLNIYLILEADRSGTGMSFNDAQEAMGMERLDLFAKVDPWLIMLGQLAVGLPLLFFGLRGLVRRIKAGLPEDHEGVAETSAGRLGQGLIYLAGSAVGAYLLLGTLLGAADFMEHRNNSLFSEAIIERISKSDGSQGEAKGMRYADYAFRTEKGEVVHGRMKVPNFPGKEFTEGGTIIVGFLPSDPSVHEWEGLRSADDYLINMAIYAALLIGGFWGMICNFSQTTRLA